MIWSPLLNLPPMYPYGSFSLKRLLLRFWDATITLSYFQWDRYFHRSQAFPTILQAENKVILRSRRKNKIGRKFTSKVSTVSKMPSNMMNYCTSQTNLATMFPFLGTEITTLFPPSSSALNSIKFRSADFPFRKRKFCLWGWINSTTSTEIKIRSYLSTLPYFWLYSSKHHLKVCS